jgi:hypothetical protein
LALDDLKEGFGVRSREAAITVAASGYRLARELDLA